MTALPIIDLGIFEKADLRGRQEIATRIGAACESIGFIYVRNHGVSDAVIESAFAAVRRFFALPEEEKRRVARPPGRYRGYIPTTAFSRSNKDRPPVLYEAFIVGEEIAADDPRVGESKGLIAPNLWPDRPPEFRISVLNYWDEMTRLARLLLRAFALALDLEEERLLRFFRQPMTNISLLHYPAREADGRDDTNAHHDTNALTILKPGEVGGLEVLASRERWIEVPPEPGCFVVNIGNMMATWSGGRFRSTLHRVHPPRGRERHSIAYFASPDFETMVEPLVALPDATSLELGRSHAGQDFAEFVALFDRP